MAGSGQQRGSTSSRLPGLHNEGVYTARQRNRDVGSLCSIFQFPHLLPGHVLETSHSHRQLPPSHQSLASRQEADTGTEMQTKFLAGVS